MAPISYRDRAPKVVTQFVANSEGWPIEGEVRTIAEPQAELYPGHVNAVGHQYKLVP
jgi:hypothetical protein